MSEQEQDVGERPGAGEAGIAENPQGGAGIGFFINRHYLQDLSVENPVGRVAVEDLPQLRYGLDGRVDANPTGTHDIFLVGINMQFTSMLREKVVFLVDITYRVEVELHGIPEPVAPFTLCVNVPEAVFPILQEILQRNGGYAGYPEMQVRAPDFRAMYVANHGI
jgi:preprotein translocase subunit SecB